MVMLAGCFICIIIKISKAVQSQLLSLKNTKIEAGNGCLKIKKL